MASESTRASSRYFRAVWIGMAGALIFGLLCGFLPEVFPFNGVRLAGAVARALGMSLPFVALALPLVGILRLISRDRSWPISPVLWAAAAAPWVLELRDGSDELVRQNVVAVMMLCVLGALIAVTVVRLRSAGQGSSPSRGVEAPPKRLVTGGEEPRGGLAVASVVLAGFSAVGTTLAFISASALAGLGVSDRLFGGFLLAFLAFLIAAYVGTTLGAIAIRNGRRATAMIGLSVNAATAVFFTLLLVILAIAENSV